ncbi:MAG: hypothetical protein AAF752_02720 [Bacteroidota bacterium]
MGFRLHCGPADAGWVAFSLHIDGRDFEANASHLGAHPVDELVTAAVDFCEHFFVSPYVAPEVDIDIVDEPGGLRLAFVAEGDKTLRLRVYDRGERLLSDATAHLDELLFETTLPIDTFAREVYRMAGCVLAQQGLLGLRVGWTGPPVWDNEFMSKYTFPLELYLYLGCILNERRALANLTLHHEIDLLRKLLGPGLPPLPDSGKAE